MNGWEPVYSDGFAPAVELRRVVLENYAIPAIILNKKDSSYHFGMIELYVPSEHATRARLILDEQYGFNFSLN